ESQKRGGATDSARTSCQATLAQSAVASAIESRIRLLMRPSPRFGPDGIQNRSPRTGYHAAISADRASSGANGPSRGGAGSGNNAPGRWPPRIVLDRPRHRWRSPMKCAHLAFILLLLGACSSAEAHTFWAPDTVTALPGGAFHYSWVFTAVGVPAGVGGAGWSGVINTPGGAMSQGGCTYKVLPGGQYRYDVSGTLTNPAQAGKIQNWIDECENFTYWSYTVIRPARHRIQVALHDEVAGADQDQRAAS